MTAAEILAATIGCLIGGAIVAVMYETGWRWHRRRHARAPEPASPVRDPESDPPSDNAGASAYPAGDGRFWYDRAPEQLREGDIVLDESHQWRKADLTPFLQQVEAYARRVPYPWQFAASNVPNLLPTVRTVDLSAPEEER